MRGGCEKTTSNFFVRRLAVSVAVPRDPVVRAAPYRLPRASSQLALFNIQDHLDEADVYMYGTALPAALGGRG